MADNQQPAVKTLVVNNFHGMMTDYYFGDINSGRSWVQISSGQNPFLKAGQLTWSDAPTQIDPNGTVITDLIMDAKERVESGILYVYAIGHTGRLYKIQVNNPSTYNADYDNPVLLTTLSINSPTFKYGGFIDFFGSTEQIYIGHDVGLTRINFDGSSETFVGVVGSWTQNVPRPIRQFVGKMYIGNGANIAEFDNTLTVTSYAKLNPGFPSNTQVRDMDMSVDGNYLLCTVSRLPLFDVTSTTQQTTTTANAESYIYYWNGSDVAPTSIITFPSFSMDANILFQDKQYLFGRDQYGSAIFTPTEKIIYIPEAPYISPNAIRSLGSMLFYIAPLYYGGYMQAVAYTFGNLDYEVGSPLGYWSPFYALPTAPQTDLVSVPMALPVSNEGLGSSSNQYTNNVFGTSKIYFSTIETSAGTTKYRLYKWKTVATLQIPNSTNALAGADSGGTYQTQTQMFSKKIAVKEVRVYGDPWVDGVSFNIALTGSSTNPGDTITGSSKTFTVGTNLTAGDDFAWYNPGIAPTYALGLVITNLGTTNHTINKVEIDYVDAGK